MANVLTPPRRSHDDKLRRSKTRRRVTVNVRLLAVTIVLVVVAVPAIYFWHQRQSESVSNLLLEQANRAAAESEWEDASNYFLQYLAMRPEDDRALLALAEAMSHDADTPQKRLRLNGVLYRAFGRQKENADLRLQLAENLLELGQFDSVLKLFDEKEDPTASKFNATPGIGPRAARVQALATYGGYVRGFADEDQQRWQPHDKLLKAASLVPGDKELGPLTASLLQSEPAKFSNMSREEAAKQANAIIDAVVRANPQDPEALLIRYRYRAQAGAPDAVADLDAALKLAPDHYEALLLKADLQAKAAAADAAAQPQGDERLAAAAATIKNAIEADPDNAKGYLALANLHERQKQPDEAIAVLRQAQRGLKPGDAIDVSLALVDLQLKSGNLEQAAEALADADRLISSELPMLPAATRRRVENQQRLVTARLGMARKRYGEAIVALRAVLGSFGAQNGEQVTPAALQAQTLLADALASSGRYEDAAPLYESLAATLGQAGLADGRVALVQLRATALRSAAESYMRSNQADRAVRCLDACVELQRLLGNDPASDAGAELAVKRLQAHLLRQLVRAPGDRNWSEFLAVYADAPRTPETVMAHVDYLMADDKLQQATAELKEAEASLGERPEFWRGAAVAYQELDLAADVERALQRYESLSPPANDLASLRVLLKLKQQRWHEADALLREVIGTLPEEQRLGAQLQRMHILAAAGDQQAAVDLAAQLVKQQPEEGRVLMAAIETALSSGAVDKAAAWERNLETLRGAEDFELRFLRCRRWLRQYSSLTDAERGRLAEEVTKLRTERPRWHPAAALAAKLADLNGDVPEAIAEYGLAMELGDTSVETLRNFINLHAKAGQYADAERYMARLASRQPDDSRVESMGIALAIKQKDFDEALRQAEEAVKRDPSSWRARIQRANVLALQERRSEAEAEFADAARQFGGEPELWTSWLTYLAATKQPEKAQAVLDQLARQATLPPERRHQASAQAYVLLGDMPRAQAELEQAVELDPKNVALRSQLARVLMATDVSAARVQLEEMRKLDPDNAEARRHLATILASSGSADDWAEAEKLLQQSMPESAAGDDRLRALLLSRRGGSWDDRQRNLQQAQSILEALVKKPDYQAMDIDYMLLAGVYQQQSVLKHDLAGPGAGGGGASAASPQVGQASPEALMELSRITLRKILDKASPTASNLRTYVEFLIRGLDTPVMASAPLTQREEWSRDAANRLDELELRLSQSGQGDSLEVVALRVALLKARQEDSAAADLLEKFLAQRLSTLKDGLDDDAKTRLYLQVGNLYSSLERHAEAQACYEKLRQRAPQAYAPLALSLAAGGKFVEAVDLCLEAAASDPSPAVATTLAQLLSNPLYRQEKLQQADEVIQARLNDHAEDTQLLLAVAVLYVTRDDIDQAISVFRRVLEIDPENLLALNNLATLLGEREADRRDAVSYIDRAIAVAGRSAPLLDTRGTIFVYLGDANRAIADLEEAVASGAADPRYYFHLAAAYQRAGRLADAQIMHQAARRRGLDGALLTASDKQLLADLERALGSQSGQRVNVSQREGT